jgi:hypothetical protein
MAAGLSLGVACSPVQAPAVSFLFTTADSTFLVVGANDDIEVRRSALLLAQIDGRFGELYLHDDDRSYFDALFVGQRIYHRDLIAGDSSVLWTDSVIADLAAAYGRAHPGERPLQPSEETAEEPTLQATTESELLGVEGPFLNFEYHRDVDVDGATVREHHLTSRGVIDLRTGHRVQLVDLLGATEAQRLLARARVALAAARDSVLRERDERSRRAARTIEGFDLDANSFNLTSETGRPAVSFLVPGRRANADGYALQLPPLEIAEPSWWAAHAETLPTDPAARDRVWPDSIYEVTARVDEAGETSEVGVKASRGRRLSIGRVTGVVERVYRLRPGADDVHLRALRHAFDDAQRLTGDARVAMLPGRPSTRRDGRGTT